MMHRCVLCATLICALCAPALALAGSPWWVDEKGSGTPYTWPGGQIVYVTDTGGLKPFTQTEIVEKVKLAFSIWANAGLFQSGSLGSGQPIPTVNLLPTLGGEVGKKITLGSLEALAKKGPVLVFDADGSLIKNILKIDPQGIRAVTMLNNQTDLDATTLRIFRGITILNGLYVAGEKEKDEKKNPVVGAFMAALVHEIGHLLNLDHSGLNAAQLVEINADLNAHANELPTMYPIVVDHLEQMYLHWDDIVAISNLYPRAALTTQFCTIAGSVIGNDGFGFQGAQVMARNVQDQMTVAVSAITGNAFPQGAADGSYILRGIIPGKAYGVTYEELPKDFTGFSSIQPYGDDDGELPRSGFGAGLITGGGGKAKTVQCLKAGETILMDTVQFAIPSGATWKPEVALVPSQNQPIMTPDGKPVNPQTGDSDGADGDGASSGGSCSLVRE